MHGMLGLIFPGIPMLVIMLLSACFGAEPAQPPSGDLVWRNGTMTIRLTERPCGFKSMDEELTEAGIPPVRALVLEQEGRPAVPGCWVPAAYDDEVLLRDVSGGDGFMPLSWFVPDAPPQ